MLLSLSGILFTSSSIDVSSLLHFSQDSKEINLINGVCSTVIICLPIVFFILSPYLQQYLPRLTMLKRIGIGALLTPVWMLSVLLIDSIGHATKNYEVPCFLSDSDITLDLSPYLNSIPYLLKNLSYVILTISLIEFIIAHSMKGVWIGFYYVLHFGLSGTLGLVEYITFEKYPVYSNSLSCGTVYYIITITIALLSLICYIFCV